MRQLCLAGAILLVLVTNGWAVRQAILNRSASEGGTLRLTERELPFEPIALESSVTILRFHWTTPRLEDQRFGPAAWLDTNKLVELGFDCAVPVLSAKARRHYEAMPPRRVYLALEYRPPGAESPSASGKTSPNSGLAVVDASLDEALLRQRYRDPGKHAICRGVVRVDLREHDSEGRLLERPQIAGWVQGLSPAQIFVPRPVNQLLRGLHAIRPAPQEHESGHSPRFSATVHWGKSFEPWVEQVQALEEATP